MYHSEQKRTHLCGILSYCFSWSLGGAFAWILLAAVGDALHLYSQYDELYQGVVKPK